MSSHSYLHCIRTFPCFWQKPDASNRSAACIQEARPHTGFRRKYWRTSKLFVWLDSTKPMMYDIDISKNECESLIGWYFYEIDGEHLIYMPANENPILSGQERNAVSKQQNKRTEFYFYLEINERRTHARKFISESYSIEIYFIRT